MKPIRTALVGCGYWGSKLLVYLKKDKRFKVCHLCDSKTDMRKVWPMIEAVVVATPIKTHYQVVRKALLKNKHVFSEKPLALKTKECLKLKEIAKRRGLVLAVEYTQTFSKSLQKAASGIDIGRLRAIEMSVKHLGRFLDFDVYWLLASHCLSILDMFVSLEKLNFKRNDLVVGRGMTETGQIIFWNKKIKGQIFLSLNFPGKEYQVIIYGQKGTIVYNTEAKQTLRTVWYRKDYKKLPSELVYKSKSWSFDEKNNLKHSLDYFYKVLKGREKSNLGRTIRITRVLEELSKTSFKNTQ